MASVQTELFKGEVEGRRIHAYRIALDSTYPTGGEAVTANSVGLTRIDDALIGTEDGIVFKWDAANSKIMAYYADYDAVADGALIECPNDHDLSGVDTVLGIFFGI